MIAKENRTALLFSEPGLQEFLDRIK